LQRSEHAPQDHTQWVTSKTSPFSFPLTITGWLTDTYSWRWVSCINLPIALASLIMISLFLYDPPY
jgi:MFS family permease